MVHKLLPREEPMGLYVFCLILIHFSYQKSKDRFDLNTPTGISVPAIVVEAPDIIITKSIMAPGASLALYRESSAAQQSQYSA